MSLIWPHTLAVYDGLLRIVGRGKESQSLEALARPHVLDTAMDEGYRAMSNDHQREAEATEWINGLIGDVANAARRSADICRRHRQQSDGRSAHDGR